MSNSGSTGHFLNLWYGYSFMAWLELQEALLRNESPACPAVKILGLRTILPAYGGLAQRLFVFTSAQHPGLPCAGSWWPPGGESLLLQRSTLEKGTLARPSSQGGFPAYSTSSPLQGSRLCLGLNFSPKF